MKTIGITGAIALLIRLASCQLFAQGYTKMDTVYTPPGYPEGPLQATMYLPSTSNGNGVVLAHAAGGTRQTPHAWCEAFAANGYVAMSIDYFDFSSVVNCRYPKPIRAYKTAIEFLRRNALRFGIRTGKIVGFGQSEGSLHWGEAVTEDDDDTFLGTDSLVADSVDAAVLLYGAYNNENSLQSTLDINGLLANFFTDYPGMRATKGNCIANFLNIRCPVLLFHGLQDDVLQFQQSLELRDSMAAHHMNIELVSGSSWGHNFDVSYPNATFTTQGLVARDSVLAFLRRELQLPSTSVNEPITHLYQYSLNQNYPNPFNPTTTIEYVLPHQLRVTLTVYNTLGQQVATLVNSEIDTGYHEVQFNAGSLASGVYFYRLHAGSFVQTRSLCLVR